MLSLHPQDHYQQSTSGLALREAIAQLHSPAPNFSSPCPTPNMGEYSRANGAAPSEAVVARALDTARNTPDGAEDPVVNAILEAAIDRIWKKVEARPDSYIMSRGEFAVFNYYQVRFTGNSVAIAARKRYWDNTHA